MEFVLCNPDSWQLVGMLETGALQTGMRDGVKNHKLQFNCNGDTLARDKQTRLPFYKPVDRSGVMKQTTLAGQD